MAAVRVLVVDDLPSIVSLVDVILAQEGHEVLTETSPRRALDLVRGGRPVDLIISDVVMPEMTGPELIREIWQVSPATHAVLMSGFADLKELPPGVPLLHKPFSAADLLSTVERLLKDAREAVMALRLGRGLRKDLLTQSRKLRAEVHEVCRVTDKELSIARHLVRKKEPGH